MRWNDRLLAKARAKARVREQKALTLIAEQVRETTPWIALEQVGGRLALRAKGLRASLARSPTLRAVLGGWA